MKLKNKIWDSVMNSVWDSVWNSVWKFVGISARVSTHPTKRDVDSKLTEYEF